MSILDDIKAAEQAAIKSKQDTNLEVRNILRNAEAIAQKEADELIVAARNSAKATVKLAEEKAKNQAKDIVAQKAREDRAIAHEAKAKLPEAVRYIVEKVVV